MVLSTLAVFYDQVWLPYPYGFEKEGIWFRKKSSSDLPPESQNDIYNWTTNWGPLIYAGILKTLPPPIPPGNLFSVDKRILNERGLVINNELLYQLAAKLDAEYEGINPSIAFGATDDIYHLGITEDVENLSLAIHAAYSQKIGPELFINDPTDSSTSRLAGVLVQSLFEYHIPQLQALTAEQILEVRDYIKDTKEGFTDYIFEMVDDMETRIKSGDMSEEIAAQKTVERKLIPWYDEVRRQLQSKKIGFWANVLATGVKFLKIDAAPWTPKFYGDLFEIFFSSVDKIKQAKVEALSNANQAFQYLARLESKVAEY